MAFHTVTQPFFVVGDFLWGFVDFLNTETLAYLGLLAVVGFAFWKIRGWYTAEANQARIREAVEQEMADQKRADNSRQIHHHMKAVVNLTEHRRNSKGAA